MRCKNCGWPNKPSETHCVKCHTPLTAAEDDMDYVADDRSSSQSTPSLNKTVLEEAIFGDSASTRSNNRPADQTVLEDDNSLTQCPKCGYPVRQGAEKCPNCKFQLRNFNDSRDVTGNNGNSHDYDSHRRPTRMNSNGESNNKFQGTVNPYMMNFEIEPSFILRPIKRIDERRDFEEQEYEGDQVVLNRDNTEPNNPSITSRQQAVITNIDGNWYIEDKSEQKTTFVQASQKIELHDGDIILLGNRLFEFHK